MPRSSPLAALLICAFSVTAAEKLPKADRIAAPPTPQQAALIREGIARHDQKDYLGAIAKYKQALAENPWEVNALHELSFTYFENKQYAEALETARLGAHCRSDGIAKFYMMMGNALDELGKPGDAIDVYRAAIKQQPTIGLLHYNLGISLKRAGKAAEAKAAIERGLQCAPDHATSHVILGQIYQEMGYRVPAILAYSRFLALEAESPRAARVLPALQQLLTSGVGTGKEPGHINIMIGDPGKGHKDEGDFMGVEMMMSITLAADLIAKPEEVKNTPKTQFQRLAAIYSSMCEAIDNSKPKVGFAANYYAPYFAALERAGHTEAFAAVTWKAANIEGASEWTSANGAKLAAFTAWSKAYSWPSK